MNVSAQVLDTMPWYKQKWPWFLMLFPVLAIIGGVITFILAQVSFDGMVVDDYYKRGLEINQVKDRDHKAVDLGLTAQAMIGAGGVRVFLTSETGMQPPERMVMHFYHVTRGNVDQTVDLELEGGFYSGSLLPLPPGRWRLTLEDTEGVWRLVSHFNPAEQESARLLPLPLATATALAEE
ncbi:MAG: FixH family protein [Zoogloeaceae bacterium]|jgi:hypothetical protein|nr:FixH family protein [Zoogloeaceae bacterium]